MNYLHHFSPNWINFDFGLDSNLAQRIACIFFFRNLILNSKLAIIDRLVYEVLIAILNYNFSFFVAVIYMYSSQKFDFSYCKMLS